MSMPIDPKTHTHPIEGALFELLDAISALNMCPAPIDPTEQVPDNPGYLSYTDRWAEHAVEHMRAAVECIRLEQNRESASVRLLKKMLAEGAVAERDIFNILHDIKDNNMSPGQERDLHMRYLKFRHQMEVESGE